MQKLVFQISIGMKQPTCKQNPNIGDIVQGERQGSAEGDLGILGLKLRNKLTYPIQTK